ncbi:MAG: DUF1598 domain-containing protein [Planctomyces sp.]|nr:DUF1598 domain-containing protein [Planctomyces sp.]
MRRLALPAVLLFAAACTLLAPRPAAAQLFPPAGVLIDAEGVLRVQQPPQQPQRRQRAASRKRDAADVVCVSLRRLELSCREAGGSVDELPPELQTLGGLYRIDEVLLVPEENDILLIGPAEPPAVGEGAAHFGSTTGRPLIRLEDWVVALRAASRSGVITCSIDPDPDRLRKYDAHIRNTLPQVTLATAPRWYAQLADILGRQDVSISGVPEDSRIASVLAIADYSMKRIAIGVEPSGVPQIKSQLALAGADRGATMQRWWFAPLYDPVEVNADRSQYRLFGPRVQLCAQEELIGPDGRRRDAAQTRLSSQRFAQNFTEHYEALADRQPVFAELHSLFDVAIAAALIVRERLPQRADCPLPAFFDAESLTTPAHTVPRFVESQALTRKVNATTVVGLVGGISISFGDVLSREQELTTTREIAEPPATDGDSEQGPFAWKVEPIAEPSRKPR